MRQGVGKGRDVAYGDASARHRDRTHVGAPLEPKLHAPSVRQEWVERSDLLAFLDRSSAKLVLIAAPAGYGKTTLLAQWCSLSVTGRSFAWVSLGQEDNDPTALWRLVVHALHRACPAVDAKNLWRPLEGGLPDVTGMFLPTLINALAALPEPVTVVLDDYHLISEPACHDQLEFLLLHLPPQAQLAISSRADPPLPVARLRARGDLTEIGMAELRLAPEEATAVIQELSGVQLGHDELHILAERTEGWPAGVCLAALSLRGRADPGDFVRKFTGSHRYVGDFLAGEVINRQPAHTRQFLLHTAVLRRFNASLCTAVSGAANAQEILEDLTARNLFVVLLDDRREWFRYHHLFAEALQSALARTEPAVVPTLHQRASAWHRRWGSAEEAIEHALAAGDVDTAVSLIAEHWYACIDAGRIATVRAWLRSVGDDEIRTRPLAAHCAAWVAVLTGDRVSLGRWLPVVQAGGHDGPLPDGMRSLQSSAALLAGTFGLDGLATMRAAAAKAVDLEDDPASPWYALARAGLGVALYFGGEYAAARQQLDAALFSEPRIARVRVLVTCFRCLVALEEGRLAQARALAALADDIVSDLAFDLDRAPQGSFAYLAVGAVYASQRRLQEARDSFERVLQSRRELPGLSPWPKFETLLRLAPVLQELEDKQGAAALLAEARDVLTALPDGAQAQLNRLRKLQQGLQDGGPAWPLTASEKAVLQALHQYLSRRERAQALNVSMNTIKSHTQAIYPKLGVSSREDAIQRGRALGII
jgi:LuxR family transcriptional regulator, maltose regulon positive regulatory protein